MLKHVMSRFSAESLNGEAVAATASPLAVPSRRGFLLATAAAGAALTIGFRPIEAEAAGAPPAVKPMDAQPFAAYLRIAPDGKVTVISSQFDMGQGSWHGLATLVAEELGCDFSKIDVEGGWGNVKLYGNLAFGGAFQGTGGSTSIAATWDRYRLAGAAARLLIAAAASETWGVPVNAITIANGIVTASGKSAGIGDFAAKAATLPVPAEIPLKASKDWTLIGSETLKRYDSQPKTNGTQQFTIDVKLPGMLTAVMIHPPMFGAKLKSFDSSKAKGVKGFVEAVATPRGVGVVAENMWAAIKAREVITATWDEAEAEKRGSAEIMALYRDLAAKEPEAIARTEGDADKAMASAAKVLKATFEFPYLAHAALEAMNAVVRMNPDGTLELWSGHQFPDVYQGTAAKIAGIAPDKVKLHVLKSGGSFGRRATTNVDFISEVVFIGAALKWRAPVKLQWTREDDMRAGQYRPAFVHAMQAGLDKDGKLVAWTDRIVGQSIMKGTMLEAGMIKHGIDPVSVEGSANIPYAIPNVKVGLTTPDVKVPVLWWRSVGSTHSAYAVEAFLDEVAEAAGKDPVAFRLAMLEHHPRHAGVLKLAAEKANWSTPPAPGRFRGIAVAESFGSYVAQVVEISLGDKGAIKVERVVCAVDCGIAVNPDVIRAQMEGGIGFGLGAILGEEITLTAGKVEQGNYDAYTPLRIDQMPKVEVHIVKSAERPTGVGEPGVPPIGPALANAVYKATGKRIRVLPFAKSLSA